MRRRILGLAVLLALLGLGTAAAQPPEDTKEKKEEKEKTAEWPKAEDKLVTTQHKATIGGKEVRYTATAGTLVLREEEGKPRANIFFVAYTRDGVQDRAKRPVTFAYNGGPGSSSVWLHMGAFGPRRVEMGAEGMALPPPYRLVDNGESLLDVTDLVFIDPVTTGYSRAVPGEDAKKFHGIKEDAEAVAELIRLWTTRFGRWSSPKFLAGESYGTTRSARLSNLLQEHHGMYLNGVILISSILNFQTARFNVGNDLPYPLFLPTYTATAWYHKRLPPDLQAGGLQKAVEEAERFAMGEYTLALMQGNDLEEARWNDIAAKVSRYTGLSADYVKRTNLRPEIQAFVKELLRDQRTTVGRLDSRFKGMDRDAAGENNELDPSYAAIQGPFTATFNDYVSQDLGFKSDLPYEILTDRVRPWSYGEFANQYANVAEDLRQAMSRNPALKVFVGNGYYDLATPFFATRYTFDHLGFEPDYERRVTMHYYEAGHMMYIRRADHEQLKKDIAAFIAAAGGG
ncbi:MAG TPA: peptidase S10 [Thermoanaerobaculia bacterium]|jgi:carboxypeptidase C (cathepsin A)|nr:peptidase S10 [Thermoanaerobaculia bacterium]